MVRIQEALVVEGRYDKNTLAQIIEAPIFITNGFGIFKNPEQLSLLRTVAEKRGLIVLTDSDGAGLVIRNHLKGVLPAESVKHAYIPDVFGKEKRKAAPGKEGKVGVEGMDPETLLTALRNAGATFLDEASDIGQQAMDAGAAARCPAPKAVPITKTDLYDLGLSGRPDSKQRRKALQKRLTLPENLGANALLTALNCICTRDEFLQMVSDN